MRLKSSFQFRQVAIFVCTASLFLAADRAEAQPDRLALVGGRLIDGYGGSPLEDSIILIRGSRVEAIGREGQLDVPPGVETVDTNGMTVLPGLWESHGHLAHVGEGAPTEFMYDSGGRKNMKFADQLAPVMAQIARINLLNGITSFRDTGGPLDEQLELRRQIESGDRMGPRLFLAGPILNQGKRNPGETAGALLVGSAEDAKETVSQLVAKGVDQIKVYGFWDLPILEAVVEAAHREGVGVDADVRHWEAYQTAVKAGVDRLHHVFMADASSGYTDDELRLLIRGLRPSVLGPSGNILRGPYILPTIEMRRSYVRTFRFPESLDHARLKEMFEPIPGVYEYLKTTWQHPSSVPWGIGAPERVQHAMAKLKRFIELGGTEQIVAGTDAGTPFNFHPPLLRELENLVEAGLTPMAAIQSATLRAAQMQGKDDELGTVAIGKLADLIVVDGDPLYEISVLRTGLAHVIKGGKLVERD